MAFNPEEALSRIKREVGIDVGTEKEETELVRKLHERLNSPDWANPGTGLRIAEMISADKKELLKRLATILENVGRNLETGVINFEDARSLAEASRLAEELPDGISHIVDEAKSRFADIIWKDPDLEWIGWHFKD